MTHFEKKGDVNGLCEWVTNHRLWGLEGAVAGDSEVAVQACRGVVITDANAIGDQHIATLARTN
jgi:hypothetical protein